jgi:hypothetical protein
MDAKLKRKIETARRKRERGQAMEGEGLRELAAALAAAHAEEQRKAPNKRVPVWQLAVLAGFGESKDDASREVVYKLIRWHEAGAEGSPWKR